MENNWLGLDFSVFNVALVAAQDNWYVFANSDEVSVPVWNILIGDSGGHVEHDDGTLACNTFPISIAKNLQSLNQVTYKEPTKVFYSVE